MRYKDMTYEERREYHNSKAREAYMRRRLIQPVKTFEPRSRTKTSRLSREKTERPRGGFEPDSVKRLENEQPFTIQPKLQRLREEFKKIPILKRPPYDEWLRYRVNEILTKESKTQ